MSQSTINNPTNPSVTPDNGASAETLSYAYYPQGTEKSVLSTVGTTNYYLMEHAIYDAAGRSDRLYLGAASQGSTRCW